MSQEVAYISLLTNVIVTSSNWFGKESFFCIILDVTLISEL